MLEFLRRQLALLVEQRAALVASVDAALTTARTEKRDALTAEEQTAFDAAKAALVAHDAKTDEARTQLAEAEETERRAAVSAAATAQSLRGYDNQARTDDGEVYRKEVHSVSYVRDLCNITLGRADRDTQERMQRHAKQVEARALGNTNTTGGSGGELAPPTWLVNDWIALTRPGRVTADLYNKSPVPAGTSSINIPKVTGGTSVAIQSTQNSALSQTDLTTAYVSTGFTTVGGKQVVSQQLLDQTAIAFDDVVKQDLAADYSRYFGNQVIYGAGSGANNNSVLNGLVSASVASGNAVTFTTGSPTASLLYSKLNGMLASFVTLRFAPPTHWLMHPRRWYWLMAQTDGNGRPLVVPRDVAFNPIAAQDNGVGVAGHVGTLLGLPVVIDPQLPTNLGSGTNQDEIFLLKADDLWLFESEPRAEVFREPYADSVGVLFRIYNYAGTILNRYATSIATLNGTGLVAPTF